MPALGLILTSTPDIPTLRAAVAAARVEILKVVPAWGLAGGWIPAAIAEVARLCPQLVVRTSWGDPSCADGTRAFPIPDRILDELAPWLGARPDAWVEVGNEPLIADRDTDLLAWQYRYDLERTIAAIRARWPRARLIAPAHLLNHPIRLGSHVWGQRRMLEICADVYTRCDAVAIHAYTDDQYARGQAWLDDLGLSALPVWVTEANLNEGLDDATRAQRLSTQWRRTPVEAVLLYHLDLLGGADPMHFNPNYQLTGATLAALAEHWRPAVATPTRSNVLAPEPAPDPDTAHYPDIRVDGFLMDVRHWKTVAAFRRHLAQYAYAQTAPWAQGVTLHHTWKPVAADWAGARSLLGIARFYRHTNDWGRGPHLFVASGSPNAEWDGIWQLSPLNVPGIHAVSFNATHWGIEMAGNFDAGALPPDTAALACGAAATLLDWADRPTTTTTLNGHRNDPTSDKTCPGRQVDISALRRAVAALREKC